MIPTRDEIADFAGRMHSMRAEVTRLRDSIEASVHVLQQTQAERDNLRKSLAEINTDYDKAIAALAKSGWTRDGAEWKPPIGPNPSPLLEQIDKLRAEVDRLTGENGRIYTELTTAREDEAAECERADRNAGNAAKLQADLDRANTEAALARDALAKASDPAREEEIKAWRDWALGDIADPDLYDDCFVLSRAEIDAAVSLMRSAGDGKALLRELAPVPDDTRELVAQLADLVAWAMPTMNHHKGVKAIAAKLRGGA